MSICNHSGSFFIFNVLINRKNDRLEWTGDYSCKTLMSSIYEEVKNSSFVPMTMDLSVMEKKYYNEEMDPIDTNTTMLKDKMADKNVSISVICANPPNVRALMLGAQRAGMVDSGQFVFFNMDLFDMTDIDKYRPWVDENATEEENKEAQHAFQSVLTVTAGTASSLSDNYTIFSSRVRQLAQQYFNYSHEEAVSTFAANFYDAALLYCHGE